MTQWGAKLENQFNNFSISFDTKCCGVYGIHLTSSDIPIALSITNEYSATRFKIVSENKEPNSYCLYFAVGK